MPSATLDTHVYVSALEYAGKSHTLLQMALDGEIDVNISQPIIDETLRVLRDKFSWSAADLQEAQTVLDACARKVTPTQTLDVIKEDPSDNRILECAAEAGSEFIVSGDKDLLRPGQFGNTRIVKVAEFLGIMQGRGPAR